MLKGLQIHTSFCLVIRGLCWYLELSHVDASLPVKRGFYTQKDGLTKREQVNITPKQTIESVYTRNLIGECIE